MGYDRGLDRHLDGGKFWGTHPLWGQHLRLKQNAIFKWKHFPGYWPFVWGIHRSPVNSPHKGQWCGALMFSFICVWINSWVNNREAGYLRHYRAHYDVIVTKPDPMKNVLADNFPSINDVFQWLGWTHFPGLLSFSDLLRTFFKRHWSLSPKVQPQVTDPSLTSTCPVFFLRTCSRQLTCCSCLTSRNSAVTTWNSASPSPTASACESSQSGFLVLVSCTWPQIIWMNILGMFYDENGMLWHQEASRGL